MQILCSTLDHMLDLYYEEFEDTFGFGPCGAYAALRREQKWGDVAVCMARAGQTVFPHYVIVQDNAIIDLTNPLEEELEYSEIEILEAYEIPELCDDGEATAWLRERMAG